MVTVAIYLGRSRVQHSFLSPQIDLSGYPTGRLRDQDYQLAVIYPVT